MQLSTIKATRAKDGNISIYIKLHPHLEQFFAKNCETSTPATSGAYKTQFYSLNSAIIRKIGGLNIRINEYGSSLMSGYGDRNLSVLRTVGTTKGVKITVPDILTKGELEQWCTEAGAAVKKLYQELISPCTITTTVSNK